MALKDNYMGYSRSNMIYSDYQWPESSKNNADLTGNPKHVHFNPRDGYHVLYLINNFLKTNGLVTKGAGVKAEIFLHDKFPPYLDTQLKALSFLYKKW